MPDRRLGIPFLAKQDVEELASSIPDALGAVEAAFRAHTGCSGR